MIDLTSRTALVTGASRGIGAAVARALAAARVNLGLVSRSGDDLGIENAVAIAADVRDSVAMRAAAATTAERFGGIDIVVINAGVGSYGPFLDLPEDELEDMIDVNVKGAIYTARAALPYLIDSDAGDLVMLASVAGLHGLPFEAVYCSSKFTTVAPGGVATDFAMGRGRTPDMPELDGMMSAEDVADAVMYVLTRPRTHRILEVAFRPVSEAASG